MSTSEEIREVFNQDIERKSKIVRDTKGVQAFYDRFQGMSIKSLLDLDKEDRKLLARILEEDLQYIGSEPTEVKKS